jgi:8-oxo-dGTP pyrophosphatase MutT (NUDIX family)
MSLRPWRKVSESVVFTNPWWSYRLDRVELPSGRSGEYHYVHTEGSAMVVPLTASGDLVMVRQFRHLAGRDSLEFPGGGVKGGASHEEAAVAELAEEAGLAAAQLRLVGRFNPFNGVTDEMCHVFVATGLRPSGGSVPDETEELELETVGPGELEGRIRSGEIWDGMTIAAWHLARAALG